VTSTSTKEGQALFALQLENGEWSVAATRTIPPSSTVGPIQQRGGELLYLLYNYTPSGLRHTVELYGVSLSDLGPGAIPAKLLYTYQFPRSMDKRQSLGGFRYVFGPGMFAYLDGTTLRALTYDSETNLPLEDGVTDIFNVEPVAP
jgi:hypothetical protein